MRENPGVSCSVELGWEKTSMPYILKRSKQEFSGKKSLEYIKHLAGCKTV